MTSPSTAAPQSDSPSTEAAAPKPATAAAPSYVDAANVVAYVWLLGIVVAATWLLAGVLRVSRVARSASDVREREWLDPLEVIARGYGVTRRIRIARTGCADLLATWGALRPQVLLPCHSRDWAPDRIHVILCHELAHIRRHDWLVQMLAEAFRAMLWFNPLAWIICARLRRESEQACDDEVLAVGVGGGNYAAHLIDLARLCRRPRSTWASALPMAHPSTLERRITAMLNPRLDRHAPSRRALASVGVALLLITLPVAALRARQAAPATLAGTIYDVTGGVIPGARVTVVDGNQITKSAQSNASGRFEFPDVDPGRYVLNVALPGFRSLRHELTLRNAPDWNRAVILQIGDVTESVSVSASRMSPAVPAAVPTTRVRIGGNVRAPRKVFDAKPVYPVSMREAGLSGVVHLQAVVGTDGSVSSVRVLSGQAHPDLAVAAADAVRQWRYSPTLLNGAPVELTMTVTVSFDLSR